MAQVSAGGSSLEAGIQNMLGSMPNVAKIDQNGFNQFAHQMQVQQAVKGMRDQAAMADAFKNNDSTTPEGQAKIIRAVGGVDPMKAVQLQGEFAKNNAADVQLKTAVAKLDPIVASNHAAQAKTIIDSTQSVLDYSKQLAAKGITGPIKEGMMQRFQDNVVQQELQNGTITPEQAKAVPSWKEGSSETYWAGINTNEKKTYSMLTDHITTVNNLLHPAKPAEFSQMLTQRDAIKNKIDNGTATASDKQDYADLNKAIAKKNAPSATTINMEQQNQPAPTTYDEAQQKSGYGAGAFNQLVESYRTTGKLPSIGRNKQQQYRNNLIIDAAGIKYPKENLAANSADYKANEKALSNITTKVANIDRISNSVTTILPKITELSNKINTRFGGEFGNQTINDFISKYGDDKDVQELKTLVFAAGREYVEATTMPGSNAQMHTGAQETAQELMNGNMPMNKLAGSIKGMGTDISAVKTGAEQERQDLMDRMSGKNKTNTNTAPVQIKDAAGYDALPSGAQYIDPQGNHRTKK